MRTFVTARRSRGFTLIELMIVVAIVTVLAMIAIPSYNSQIRKSRRSEAKTALFDLAGPGERYMSTTGAYTSDGKLFGVPRDRLAAESRQQVLPGQSGQRSSRYGRHGYNSRNSCYVHCYSDPY